MERGRSERDKRGTYKGEEEREWGESLRIPVTIQGPSQ